MTSSEADAGAKARSGPILQLVGVRKTFGQLAAVDRIDLDVLEGEFLTIVGPSGSGKTTLLRMLAGHGAADRGQHHCCAASASTTCRRTGGRPAWCSSRWRSSRTRRWAIISPFR